MSLVFLSPFREQADIVDGAGSATLSMAQAGAEFAEFILQAAFNGKASTVQAYVDLGADAGGEEVKKEIGTDLGYFSVNIQLGVSPRFSPRERGCCD